MQFLSLAEVIDIHVDLVSRYGGQVGIRDLTGRPSGDIRRRLPVLRRVRDGGRLRVPPSPQHPFVDGNKRTALSSALVFLEMNGISVGDPRGTLYDATLNMAAGTVGMEDLAKLFGRLGRDARERRP